MHPFYIVQLGIGRLGLGFVGSYVQVAFNVAVNLALWTAIFCIVHRVFA
jgi:hypothetical protein